jgi:transposase
MSRGTFRTVRNRRRQRAIPARQTHDYWRNGTTTLFAALNVLDGDVIGKCLPRHRNAEFVDFLDHMDATVPAELDIHIILDNYATHKHANVKAWLETHSRYHLHFTPTSSSWLNLVERFFAEITSRRIRRGSFRSVRELIKAIEGYISDRNRDPKAPAFTILSQDQNFFSTVSGQLNPEQRWADQFQYVDGYIPNCSS